MNGTLVPAHNMGESKFFNQKNGGARTMTAVEGKFRTAIERAGLIPPPTIIADRTLHRFSSNGDPGDDAGWYIFFDDGSPAGAFGCWREGIKQTWQAGHNGHTLTSEEKALERQRMEVVRRQREEDTQRRHKEAAEIAHKLLAESQPAPADHPYLQKKHIKAYGITVDSENRLLVPVRIAGHLTSLQTINTSGEKRFLVGGEIKGGFHLLGTVQDVAVICEGFATGASVHEATGYAVAVAFSAGNLLDAAQAVRQQYPSAHIIVAGDHDRSGVGQKSANEAATAVGGTVAIPTEEECDWNDIAVRDGLEAVKLAFAEAAQSLLDESTILIPLDSPALPEMPMDALPSRLHEMVQAVASSTETPPELGLGFALSVVATACQRHVCIEVEPDYREPLNIWTVTALPSGNRKSAVMFHMTEPLMEADRLHCEAMKTKIAAIESARETIKTRLKSLREQAAKAKSEDFEHKKQEIARLEATMPELPALPRLWAQDITPEKLGQVMAENSERLTLISDEGGLFDILAGRYSNGIPNLDILLQSHAGTSVRVHRGSRPDVMMNRPALTLALSPQPSVLKGLANQPAFRGRGLLARILYALPVSQLGYRTLASQPIPSATKSDYQRTVKALLDLAPHKDGSGEIQPYVLKLSPDAHAEWKDFQRVVEARMRDGGTYEHIQDWAGKLPGAAARLAGLLHCVEYADRLPTNLTVTLSTMQQALSLAAFYQAHALAAFDAMGADPDLEKARRVWGWVERNQYATFTARDCFQALRGAYPKMEQLTPAFSVLIERGYLTELGPPAESIGRPGRRKRVFQINPLARKDPS